MSPMPPVDQPVWYYLIGQQQIGPVPAQTIMGMLYNGTMTPASLVWRDGLANWAPVGSLPEFAYASVTRPKENFIGLNQTGLIVFIILLVTCVPLCWLPWVIDSLKAK